MRIKDLELLKKPNVGITAVISILIAIGFLIPTFYYNIPHGTDSYAHLFYTNLFFKSESLEGFYDKLKKEYFTESYYPFGFRLFGSIVMKVTGMDAFQLSIIQPVILLFLIILLYYAYSTDLIPGGYRAGLISVLLMLSTPIITIGILNYETDVFMFALLIPIFHLLTYDENYKRILTQIILLSVIPLFHAGTYLFMFSVFIVYLLTYPLITLKISRMFVSFSALLLAYLLSVNLFPSIHQQYAVKAMFILRFTQWLANITNLGFFESMGNAVYTNMFSKPSLVYIVFIVFMIYIISLILIKISSRVKTGRDLILSPAIAVTSIPHSIIFLPFWLGPLQVILSFLGVKKVDRKVLALVIPLLLITIPSSVVAGERGLREIQYLFLILPILATLGFFASIDAIKTRISSEKIRKAAFFLAFALVFINFTLVAVFGNAYYHPKISIRPADKTGLEWLGKTGSPSDGVAEVGYGHRVSVYSDKIPPSAIWIPSGKEMRRYLTDYSKIILYGDENAAKDMFSSFGAGYVIVSAKSLKGLGKNWNDVGLFGSDSFDRIFSTKEFVISRFIEKPVIISDIQPRIQFTGHPVIKDAGNFLLVETSAYKLRLNKNAPQIDYIGTKTESYIEEGDISDYIVLIKLKGEVLQEMDFSKVIMGQNIVEYHGRITNESGPVASVLVRFTFYPEAIKKEIVVSNDYYGSEIPVRVSTRFYAPYKFFTLENENGVGTSRTVYPNEDYVLLEDLEFEHIFIHDGKKGIMVKFEPTSPYPDRIVYSGSTVHENYSRVDFSVRKEILKLKPAEELLITQWISIGEHSEAKRKIVNSSFVRVYPYSRGIKPLILLIKLDEFNESVVKKVSELEYPVVVAIPLSEWSDQEIAYFKRYLKNNDWYLAVYPTDRNETLRIQSYENIRVLSEALEVPIKTIIEPSSNLKSLKLLEKYGITYVFNKLVPPPFRSLFDEGERSPGIAVIEGGERSLILLPVSAPKLSGDIDSRFSDLMSVIGEAERHGEMVVLEVDGYIFASDYATNRLFDAINFSTNVGFQIVSPEAVKNSLIQSRGVKINVKGAYPANFTLTISSEKDIDGLTLFIHISPADWYDISGPSGLSIKSLSDGVLASFDVEGGREAVLSVKRRAGVQ